MNRAKMKLLVIMVVTALTVFSAGAAWAYEFYFKNATQYDVKAEVFEIRFIGVFKSLGIKHVEPGQTVKFKTTGGFCFFNMTAKVAIPEGGGAYRFRTIKHRFNDEGMACEKLAYKIAGKVGGFRIVEFAQ